MSSIIEKIDIVNASFNNYHKEVNHRGVISVHRYKTNNVGDLYCAPYRYFKELNDYPKVDILDYSVKNLRNVWKWYKSVYANDIILGGGGLFDRESFRVPVDIISSLIDKGKRVVLWGAGHNSPSQSVTPLFYDQIKKIKLIGVRDYGNYKVDWVPCVSCMNVGFDNVNIDVKHEVGVIIHEHIKISNVDKHTPVLRNDSTFDDILTFIGSVEKLVTNSYHAMYWGMLLNKQVYVIPNSSKMFSFKYEPFYINGFDEVFKIKDKKNYSGLLSECRGQNLKFKEKVYNYLNI